MTNNLKHTLRTLLPTAVAALALATTACAVDDGDIVNESELGAPTREYKIPAQRGSVKVKVLANSNWQAEFIDPYTDWAEIENTSNANDDVLQINYQTNDSYARMAKLRIFNAERTDTILIKQFGAITPELALATPNIVVAGSGGQVRTPFTTNLDMEDIQVEVSYTNLNDPQWVTDYAYSNGYLFIDCDANPTENTRNARVKFSFTDGWGTVTSATLYQTQANKDEEMGKVIGFDEARTNTGIPIGRDLLLEGYVVSNTPDGNAGESIQTTHTGINYTPTKTTVYLQSLDGKYGFALQCKTIEDNIFQLYSKVTLMLKGTTILQEEIKDMPDVRSYIITNVTSDKLIKSESGTLASLPIKEKFMSELNDDDIYTYVTLKQCEFPVRKGSLTPVNEGYTPLFNINSLAKYPMLIRDIQGSYMYLMTNISCTYRRDGSKLPYGSGKMSGVIVHETFTRFEYSKTNSADAPENGRIGRYQLRHQVKSDIYRGMSDDFDNGFSSMLFEVRYAHIENNKALATTDNMPGYVTTTSTIKEASITGASDWSHLGPCGSGLGSSPLTGDPCGIVLRTDDGGPGEYTVNMGTGNDGGKGHVNSIQIAPSKTTGLTLATKHTWNYDDHTDGLNGTADGFLICFSTEGVTTDQLSLQFATYSTNNAPRWWKVEWSETGTKEGPWSYVESYTSVVAEDWSNRRMWSISGPKYHNINLPLEMLGKKEVFLQLRPEINVTSNYENYYNTSKQIDNTATCYLFYVGIRCNK